MIGLQCRKGTIAFVIALVSAIGLKAAPADAACPPLDRAASMWAGLSPGHDQTANTIFLSALRTISSADLEGDPERRLHLLEEAQASLDRIVRYHPGSQLAVQLFTGQQIGTFDPMALSTTVSALRADIFEGARCAEDPDACSYLADALATACDIPIAGRRAEALTLVSAGQAAAGLTYHAHQTLSDALAAADEIPPSDRWRSSSLTAVAAAQAAAGFQEEARRTFFRAVTAVGQRSTDDLQGRQMVSVAVAQAEAGLFADALDTADEADSIGCNHSTEALAAIGIVQLRAGLMDDARRTFARVLASNATSPCRLSDYPMQPYIDIAAAVAAAGLEEEARQTLAHGAIAAVDVFPLGPDRARALARIAAAQADAGLFDDTQQTITDAFAALEETPTGLDHSRALLWIAYAQAVSRQFSDAIATLDETTWNTPTELTRAAIAAEQAAAGFEGEARRTFADALARTRERAPASPIHRILSKIGVEQAAAGFEEDARITFAEAVAATGSFSSPSLSSHLARIAENQAEAGFPADALDTVGAMPAHDGHDDRVDAMAAIGAAQASAGDAAAARRTLAAAVMALGEAPAENRFDLETISDALLVVVEAQTSAALAGLESE